MKRKKINLKIDYTKLDIISEYNTDDIKYPIILASPHSGTVIPQEFLKKINLSKDELRNSEDIFVTELMQQAIDLGFTMLSMNMHRTFIDVNRAINEIDNEMYYDLPQKDKFNTRRARYGLGLIHKTVAISKNIYDGLISHREVAIRIKKTYVPYHKKLKQLINRCHKKFGFCLLIDCHAMPNKICSIMNETKRIDFCIGDLFGKSCPEKVVEALKKMLENNNYRVELNRPYSGAYTAMKYTNVKKRTYILTLETNKSIYSDENVYKKTHEFQEVSAHITESLVQLSSFLLDFK